MLNLANPEASDIEFEVSQFPDGQQDLVIKTKWESMFKDKNYFVEGTPVQIKSRFNSFRDLELIICATNALKNLGVKRIHLYIPYILGARSDRKFVEGGTKYVRDIVAPIINAQGFETVTCLDPHSDVAEATINNLVKANVDLVSFALGKIYPLSGWAKFVKKLNPRVKHYNYILVSPDAGSEKKIYKVADNLGYKDEIITCTKHRSTDGKLSRTVVPINVVTHAKKDFIIVDDICDGGATFINIAKEIKAVFPNADIYLVVSHGIFSKGFDVLNGYFTGIYCTNSVKDVARSEWDGDKKDILTKVEQTNVF